MSDSILFLDSSLFQFASLIFVVMGILISIRVLNYPDLTVDGSFTIGACVLAVSTKVGFSPSICVLNAVFSGVFAGMMTITLNEKFKIGQILSSVLVMLALIAISPYLLGSATIGLLNKQTIFSPIEKIDQQISRWLFPDSPFSMHIVVILLLLAIAVILLFLFYHFFNSPLGLLIRYHGSAQSPREFLGKKLFLVKLTALAIGNGLIAFGGALEALKRGAADQSIGLGIILIALASLILGETIVRIKVGKNILSIKEEILSVVVGSLFYAFVIQTVVQLRQSFIDIRVVSTLFLAILLAISSRRYPRNLEMF
jgi:putative ABC transport system permease protein